MLVDDWTSIPLEEDIGGVETAERAIDNQNLHKEEDEVELNPLLASFRRHNLHPPGVADPDRMLVIPFENNKKVTKPPVQEKQLRSITRGLCISGISHDGWEKDEENQPSQQAEQVEGLMKEDEEPSLEQLQQELLNSLIPELSASDGKVHPLVRGQPQLIVNFSQLSGGKVKLRRDGSVKHEDKKAKLIEALWLAKNDEVEDLFNRSLLFHTTSEEWEDMIDNLTLSFSRDYFGRISYPIGSETQWERIIRRTKYDALNAMKQVVASCQRPLSWKVAVALELEHLAYYQALQNYLHVEEQPTVEKDKDKDNETWPDVEVVSAGCHSEDSVPLPLRTLGKDTEKEKEKTDGSHPSHFTVLTEQGNMSPAAWHSSSISSLNTASSLPASGITMDSIIDQILAMALSRQKVVQQDELPADRLQRLHRQHTFLRQLWKDEFGMLPTCFAPTADD
jgi:hypothetical protein